MTITSAARRIAIAETLDPLDLLYERCLTLADRVPVDIAYSAAEWSDLVDRFGDDLIQLVLMDAFVRVRP
jgi:hypothetical protein